MNLDEEDRAHAEFARRAGALLREDAERLDGATRLKLARARAAAVEEARRPAWSWLLRMAPAGAVAASVIALLLLMREPRLEVTPFQATAPQDFELLADGEAWELSQEEDFGFLEWAAAMAELDSGGG
ncbi:MAG: hypothetical protein DIU62_005240 [Pseudomonadota bacterium]|jgi:hypothetical protein